MNQNNYVLVAGIRDRGGAEDVKRTGVDENLAGLQSPTPVNSRPDCTTKNCEQLDLHPSPHVVGSLRRSLQIPKSSPDLTSIISKVVKTPLGLYFPKWRLCWVCVTSVQLSLLLLLLASSPLFVFLHSSRVLIDNR